MARKIVKVRKPSGRRYILPAQPDDRHTVEKPNAPP